MFKVRKNEELKYACFGCTGESHAVEAFVSITVRNSAFYMANKARKQPFLYS